MKQTTFYNVEDQRGQVFARQLPSRDLATTVAREILGGEAVQGPLNIIKVTHKQLPCKDPLSSVVLISCKTVAEYVA